MTLEQVVLTMINDKMLNLEYIQYSSREEWRTDGQFR